MRNSIQHAALQAGAGQAGDLRQADQRGPDPVHGAPVAVRAQLRRVRTPAGGQA